MTDTLLATGLVVVTDRHQTSGRPLPEVINEALGAGARVFQLREKDLPSLSLFHLAEELLRQIEPFGGLLMINDRLDVALAAGAHGVHLARTSLPPGVARELLGPDHLLGVSCHDAAEVEEAEMAGADFAFLGPVFETPSKLPFGPPLGLDRFRAICRARGLPLFAIGGISAERVPLVRAAGGRGVAVVSGVLAAPDVPAAVRALLNALQSPADPGQSN
ncbi:MAG: thiamine phosphate synthase [Candidatus Methylomirabilales bacterium]